MLLEQAVQNFKDWASGYPVTKQSGEWECDYPDWTEIYTAFANFIDQTDYNSWSPEETKNVLYAIARDNESEFLIDEISKQRECLFVLAEAAINHGDRDARWQIASRLGRVEGRAKNAETYLLKFLNDSDEYVRRRALLALAKTGSNRTETYAVLAWETGDEYQRIAALHALHRVSSSRLSEFIDLAMQDGRKYLVKNAVELGS